MWTNYCHCVLICHFWGILGYLQNTRVHEVSFTTLGETHHSPFGKVSTFAKQKQKISLSFSGTLWSGITYNLRQFCNSIPNLKRFEVWSIQLSGLRSDPPRVIKKMIFWLSKKSDASGSWPWPISIHSRNAVCLTSWYVGPPHGNP